MVDSRALPKGCLTRLTLQFNREEKSRLEAERREYMALKELEMLRSALATSRQQHHEVQPLQCRHSRDSFGGISMVAWRQDGRALGIALGRD